MANYVPAGENNTASKQQFGIRQPNFVDGGKAAVRQLSADEQFLEATERRKRHRAQEKLHTWQRAVEQTRRWTPSLAVENLQAMPTGIREMYLIAEESAFARPEVLSLFPAAGNDAREVWKAYATPASTIPAPKQRKTK